MGTGFSVSLVDGLPPTQSAAPHEGAEALTEGALEMKVEPAPEEAPRSELITPVSSTSDLVLDAARAPPVPSGSTEAAAHSAQPNDGAAATSTVGRGGSSADASAGGDPTAISGMLKQLARCLPKDQRPSLAYRLLILDVGEDGMLRSAPQITSSTAVTTKEERAAADRIVQAALQCGPYVDPAIKNSVISLVPDFSSIQPEVIEAKMDDARRGELLSRP